jgi:hypothetical protein
MHLGKVETFVRLDTLLSVSGIFELVEEEETYSENNRISLSAIGDVNVMNSIDTNIVYPLNTNPNLLMGNASIELELKHGIRLHSLIFGTLASIITGNESDFGLYTKQSFKQKGIIYSAKAEVLNEAN